MKRPPRSPPTHWWEELESLGLPTVRAFWTRTYLRTVSCEPCPPRADAKNGNSTGVAFGRRSEAQGRVEHQLGRRTLQSLHDAHGTLRGRRAHDQMHAVSQHLEIPAFEPAGLGNGADGRVQRLRNGSWQIAAMLRTPDAMIGDFVHAR
jgi:hypothetical protein